MIVRLFDSLVEKLRTLAASLPDCRTGANTQFAFVDIFLGAFAVFFTQSPSFLSFQKAMQKKHGRNNARSLFGLERIPTDNHIRQTLDPVPPQEIFPYFDELFTAFEQTGLLEAMRAIDNARLIALDGTWYFSSQSRNIHCPNCSCIRHANGTTTHFHSALTPVIVSPGHSQVVSLRPEFITPQDGHEKQDCEINAAKRWLGAHAQHYGSDNSTLLGDDLYAHQPFCRQVLLHGFHFFFNCKPSSHTWLTSWVEGLAAGGQLATLKLRVKGAGNRWEYHRYRWANGVPLVEAEGALKINWCEVVITDAEDREIYRNSFITDHRLNADNVAGWVAAGPGGRSRTRTTTCSRTGVTTWSTTLATASST